MPASRKTGAVALAPSQNSLTGGQYSHDREPRWLTGARNNDFQRRMSRFVPSIPVGMSIRAPAGDCIYAIDVWTPSTLAVLRRSGARHGVRSWPGAMEGVGSAMTETLYDGENPAA